MEVGGIQQKCRICGRTNHKEADCFQRGKGKHGSDPKGKGKGKEKGDAKAGKKGKAETPRFNGACNYCKQEGHKAADCRKKAADMKKSVASTALI